MPEASTNAAAACAHACPLAAADRDRSRAAVERDAGGVDRRVFLSQAAFAAAAMALTACGGDGGGGGPTAPATVGASLRVTDYPALASTGGVATATVGGTPLAIVRTGASSFLALSRICPHQGFTINTAANGFLCSGHGAQFNATGSWTGGQPTTNMRSYQTTYDAATGMLTIG